MPDRARDAACFVRENISEKVACQNDVELTRIKHELHSGVVHVKIINGNVGIFERNALRRFSPHAARLKHVCLVYAGHVSSSLTGHTKRAVRDSLDFRYRIVHVVVPRAVFVAAFCTEIHIAG